MNTGTAIFLSVCVVVAFLTWASIHWGGIFRAEDERTRQRMAEMDAEYERHVADMDCGARRSNHRFSLNDKGARNAD